MAKKDDQKTMEPELDHDHELVKHWRSLKKKPNVIVFDLDYTLWPYYVDCHVEPPLSKRTINGQEALFDSNGMQVTGFSEVTKILKTLKHHCLSPEQHIAIASRSTTPELAMQVIEHLGWKEFFSSFQIYPLNKVTHMSEIKKDLDFERYEEVLFFDDEYYNIKATQSLGLVAVHIDDRNGLDLRTFIDGLNIYAKNKKI